jgi:hypothetical protein
VLSAEIVVIALGTVADQSFGTQVAVLSGIGLIMTVGVYGVVAGIVKMDDIGLHLLTKSGALARTIGKGLLLTAPRLMKALTVIGTAAMFLVGGGILTHGIPPLHHLIEHLAGLADPIAGVGGVLKALLPPLLDMLVGVVAGGLSLLGVRAFTAIRAALGRRKDSSRRAPAATPKRARRLLFRRVTQFAPQDLSDRRLDQGIAKLDMARQLVAGQMGPAVLDHGLPVQRRILPDNHHLDRFTRFLIGHAHHRAFEYTGCAATTLSTSFG